MDIMGPVYNKRLEVFSVFSFHFQLFVYVNKSLK